MKTAIGDSIMLGSEICILYFFVQVFDPSMKKKKKKAKKIVDLDGPEETVEPVNSEEPQISENTNKENEAVHESQGKDLGEIIRAQ